MRHAVEIFVEQSSRFAQCRIDRTHHRLGQFDIMFGDHHVDQIGHRQFAHCAGEVITVDERRDAGVLQCVLDEMRINDIFGSIDNFHAELLGKTRCQDGMRKRELDEATELSHMITAAADATLRIAEIR